MSDSLDLLNHWLEQRRRKCSFPLPDDAQPIHIALVSSGEKYLPEFLKGLYVLERAMVEKGLDPAAFTIDKHPVNSGAPYIQEIYVYNYTISFHEHSYSVRKEGDMAFLAYFSTLILSEEHDELEDANAQSHSFFQRLMGWLEADAFRPSLKPD
jgi:hypothetical protein